MKKIFVAGIDEAGRGPVLGPLVICGALASKEQEEQLIELGVRDSKELSPKKRSSMFSKIKNIVQDYAIVKISAAELNNLMPTKSLNEIEAFKAAQIIEQLRPRPEIVIVDAPDVIQENYGKRIQKYLSYRPLIKSEHFADSKYAVVSAASILAKVERDAEISEYVNKYGDIGSGYWHDPATKKFIEKYVEENGKLPPFARSLWDPAIKTLESKLQKRITDFK
ncbi:MAG: ribonuclease HII [Candidatus Diapherotrites archaeon]|nr:ribonuclease HII [Candidatus Diapherotrites archaeon]